MKSVKKGKSEGRFPTYDELYPKKKREYNPSQKAVENEAKRRVVIENAARGLGLSEAGTQEARDFFEAMFLARYSRRAVTCQIKKFTDKSATTIHSALAKFGRYDGTFLLLAWFENITARGYVSRDMSWSFMQTLMNEWQLPPKKYEKHLPWRKFKHNRALECRVKEPGTNKWISVSQETWRRDYKGKEDIKMNANQSDEIAETVVITQPKVYRKKGRKRERLSDLPLRMDAKKIKELCTEIRSEPDPDKQAELKRELPVVYLCHEKPCGRNRWKERYTGWLSLDIDHIGIVGKDIPKDIKRLADTLKQWYPQVHYWRSATDGVCMYVKPDVNIKNKQHFDDEMEALYAASQNLLPHRKIDKMGMGQDQARFVTSEMLDLMLELRIEYQERTA